jgi:hypothetical protein
MEEIKDTIYTVSVRTFVIPLYYSSSFGSGSGTILILVLFSLRSLINFRVLGPLWQKYCSSNSATLSRESDASPGGLQRNMYIPRILVNFSHVKPRVGKHQG